MRVDLSPESIAKTNAKFRKMSRSMADTYGMYPGYVFKNEVKRKKQDEKEIEVSGANRILYFYMSYST